jgi:hypothetical protein
VNLFMDLHSKLCWIPCVGGVVSNLLDVTMRGFIYKVGPEDLLFKQALIGDTNIPAGTVLSALYDDVCEYASS